MDLIHDTVDGYAGLLLFVSGSRRGRVRVDKWDSEEYRDLLAVGHRSH